MVVWRWFKGLPPRTRIFVGVGVMAYARAGLYVSDWVEEKYLKPTEEDREEQRDFLPKITVVERRRP